MAERELTGRHVLFIFVGAFGTIIAVNLLLAYSAVSTFPGLEVKNSYVASQEFNERKAAQEALGWTVRATHRGGVLRLAITDSEGQPVRTRSRMLKVSMRCGVCPAWRMMTIFRLRAVSSNPPALMIACMGLSACANGTGLGARTSPPT